jgi:hypothetical protein
MLAYIHRLSVFLNCVYRLAARREIFVFKTVEEECKRSEYSEIELMRVTTWYILLEKSTEAIKK